MAPALPSIPAKRYFTIGEVGDLCDVKPHVLRYWEQEFTQLRPMKRRGNRRYYQHHEVLMIRRIRELLYDQGFTISGARNKLHEAVHSGHEKQGIEDMRPTDVVLADTSDAESTNLYSVDEPEDDTSAAAQEMRLLRKELFEIRDLLASSY